MWSQSRHFCLCIIFLDMQCVFQTPHNGPTGHIIAQHVFFLRRLVLWSCLGTLLTQSNVLILSNFGILPRVGMLPTFTIFPDLLQAFHGTQHQQGDGSNSAGSLRSSLIERIETNPEKKMYEIIDGYSLLFMAKAPRHDARVIPFKHDKM